jgi:hypothetical protein
LLPLFLFAPSKLLLSVFTPLSVCLVNRLAAVDAPQALGGPSVFGSKPVGGGNAREASDEDDADGDADDDDEHAAAVAEPKPVVTLPEAPRVRLTYRAVSLAAVDYSTVRGAPGPDARSRLRFPPAFPDPSGDGRGGGGDGVQRPRYSVCV